MNAWQFGSLTNQQQLAALAMMSDAQRVQLYRELRALHTQGVAGDDDEDGLGSWLSQALGNVKTSLGPLAASLTNFIPVIGPVVSPIVSQAFAQQPQTSTLPAPTVQQVQQRSGIDQNTMFLLLGIGALLLLSR